MEMGIDSAGDVLALAVQNKNSAVSTGTAPAIEFSIVKSEVVLRLIMGVFLLSIIFLSLWFWKKNRAEKDEHQADSAMPIGKLAEEYDDVHLDKSMVDGGVDFYQSMEDDGVDLDKSMDDEAVYFYRSMDDDFMKVTGARKFSYDNLVIATNNFSDQLGEGGFGAVYRGFLKHLNCYVAVRRISRDSRQGIKEYASEVKIISQLRHRNIVQLIGWCHERKELLLVYEFMPNGSLDSHLFKESSLLTWEVRYKIARGLALGLLYLHEEWEHYVVHRDIKASNVMLDSNFNAKLGDFGLARLGDHGKGLDNTTLAGTIGYVAPEYATTGRASKESDMYGFGIVALEIACGRKVVDHKARENQINLREWVWDLYGGGKIFEAVDPRLNGEFDKEQVECLMIVGLWCAHPDAKLRPTIEKAIHVLNFVAPLPNLPSEMPAVTYFAPFSMSSSDGDLLKSLNQSSNFGNNDLAHTTGNFLGQEKHAEGGFGVLHKGFPKERIFGLWKRRKTKKEDNNLKLAFGLHWFAHKDLVRATNNFSKQMKLGEGGSGPVYRGFLKELNSYIAVKIMSKGSNQLTEEYESEVNVISRLRHKNIVQLIGLCNSESKLFLVYEFMPNGNLDSHLSKEVSFLTWEVRYKIAKDLALGLLYLHEQCEQCVVHRDIKSSNVMLDSDFSAKIGNFGLARLMDQGKSLETTIFVGTKGYTPPESVITGKYSRESDVYSFGVVALEIACGRKSTNNVVDWVWDMYKKGKLLLEAADPRLNGKFNKQQMECLVLLGLWCADPVAKFRPSIRQVIQVLHFEAPLPCLPPELSCLHISTLLK